MLSTASQCRTTLPFPYANDQLVNWVIQVVGIEVRGYFATFTTIWLAMLSTFRIVMQDYYGFSVRQNDQLGQSVDKLLA